jgi:hypothetical protein
MGLISRPSLIGHAERNRTHINESNKRKSQRTRSTLSDHAQPVIHQPVKMNRGIRGDGNIPAGGLVTINRWVMKEARPRSVPIPRPRLRMVVRPEQNEGKSLL